MPYSNEHQITIEKTPKYFVDKQTPKRVYEMNPEIKLIIVLRNPVIRAISEYTQSLAKLNKTAQKNNKSILVSDKSKEFERLLFDNSTKKIKKTWPVIRNGLYYVHLKEWLKYFPLNQILFVNGEELIRNPYIEIERVEKFLNLKPIIKETHFIYNFKKGFPCIQKPLDSVNFKCLGNQKGRKHPVISNKILEKLNEFYRPYNIALFKKIKLKPFWPI